MSTASYRHYPRRHQAGQHLTEPPLPSSCAPGRLRLIDLQKGGRPEARLVIL